MWRDAVMPGGWAHGGESDLPDDLRLSLAIQLTKYHTASVRNEAERMMSLLSASTARPP